VVIDWRTITTPKAVTRDEMIYELRQLFMDAQGATPPTPSSDCHWEKNEFGIYTENPVVIGDEPELLGVQENAFLVRSTPQLNTVKLLRHGELADDEYNNKVLHIVRQIAGDYSETGAVLLIEDFLDNTGVGLGSAIRVIAGTSDSSRLVIDLNPRVSSDKGVAYLFDTTRTLTSGMILELLNMGNWRFRVNYAGDAEAKGNIKTEGNFVSKNNNPGLNQTLSVVHDMQIRNGTPQYKKSSITIESGIITGITTDSGWSDVPINNSE